jgi:hypothetical protein
LYLLVASCQALVLGSHIPTIGEKICGSEPIFSGLIYPNQ